MQFWCVNRYIGAREFTSGQNELVGRLFELKHIGTEQLLSRPTRNI